MTISATRNVQESPTERTWFVAFELREKPWKLGFTTGHGPKPRERTVTARQQERVLDEIAQAQRRLSLPDSAAASQRTSALHATAARRNGLLRHSSGRSMTWASPKTWSSRSKAASGGNRSCWARL